MKAPSMASFDDDKIAEGKSQLERESEARARRIALRKEQTAKKRMDSSLQKFVRTSFLAVIWFGLIGGLFILIAWNWSTFNIWLSKAGL